MSESLLPSQKAITKSGMLDRIYTYLSGMYKIRITSKSDGHKIYLVDFNNHSTPYDENQSFLSQVSEFLNNNISGTVDDDYKNFGAYTYGDFTKKYFDVPLYLGLDCNSIDKSYPTHSIILHCSDGLVGTSQDIISNSEIIDIVNLSNLYTIFDEIIALSYNVSDNTAVQLEYPVSLTLSDTTNSDIIIRCNGYDYKNNTTNTVSKVITSNTTNSTEISENDISGFVKELFENNSMIFPRFLTLEFEFEYEITGTEHTYQNFSTYLTSDIDTISTNYINKFTAIKNITTNSGTYDEINTDVLFKNYFLNQIKICDINEQDNAIFGLFTNTNSNQLAYTNLNNIDPIIDDEYKQYLNIGDSICLYLGEYSQTETPILTLDITSDIFESDIVSVLENTSTIPTLYEIYKITKIVFNKIQNISNYMFKTSVEYIQEKSVNVKIQSALNFSLVIFRNNYIISNILSNEIDKYCIEISQEIDDQLFESITNNIIISYTNQDVTTNYNIVKKFKYGERVILKLNDIIPIEHTGYIKFYKQLLKTTYYTKLYNILYQRINPILYYNLLSNTVVKNENGYEQIETFDISIDTNLENDYLLYKQGLNQNNYSYVLNLSKTKYGSIDSNIYGYFNFVYVVLQSETIGDKYHNKTYEYRSIVGQDSKLFQRTRLYKIDSTHVLSIFSSICYNISEKYNNYWFSVCYNPTTTSIITGQSILNIENIQVSVVVNDIKRTFDILIEYPLMDMLLKNSSLFTNPQILYSALNDNGSISFDNVSSNIVRKYNLNIAYKLSSNNIDTIETFFENRALLFKEDGQFYYKLDDFVYCVSSKAESYLDDTPVRVVSKTYDNETYKVKYFNNSITNFQLLFPIYLNSENDGNYNNMSMLMNLIQYSDNHDSIILPDYYEYNSKYYLVTLKLYFTGEEVNVYDYYHDTDILNGSGCVFVSDIILTEYNKNTDTIVTNGETHSLTAEYIRVKKDIVDGINMLYVYNISDENAEQLYIKIEKYLQNSFYTFKNVEYGGYFDTFHVTNLWTMFMTWLTSVRSLSQSSEQILYNELQKLSFNNFQIALNDSISIYSTTDYTTFVNENQKIKINIVNIDNNTLDNNIQHSIYRYSTKYEPFMLSRNVFDYDSTHFINKNIFSETYNTTSTLEPYKSFTGFWDNNMGKIISGLYSGKSELTYTIDRITSTYLYKDSTDTLDLLEIFTRLDDLKISQILYGTNNTNTNRYNELYISEIVGLTQEYKEKYIFRLYYIHLLNYYNVIVYLDPTNLNKKVDITLVKNLTTITIQLNNLSTYEIENNTFLIELTPKT